MAKDRIEIEVIAKGLKTVQKDIKQLQTDIKKNEKPAKKMRVNFLALGAAAVTLGASLKKVLTLFGQQEKAQRTLAAAMKQAGTFTEEAFKQNLKYASSLQKMTTFGDEAILGVQKLLTNFGIEGEELKKLTKATLDLAAAKGMDLKAAADLVAKSVGSSTNALSRYGIEVTGAVGSTERAQMAVENITKLFGGAAAAEADTFSGKVQQMKNRLGDIGESIGAKIAPLIMRLIDFFSNLSSTTQTLVVVLGGLIPVVIALQAALGPVGIIMAALAAAAVGTAVALSDVKDETKELIKLNKQFSGVIDEQLKKSGDENAANRVKIKQNKERIAQLKELIKQGKQMIGTVNLSTGQLLTENEFNKKKAEILKEIAVIEKENTELSKDKAVRQKEAAATAAEIAAAEKATLEEKKKLELEAAIEAEAARKAELEAIEAHEQRKQQIIQASFDAVKQLTSDFFSFGQAMRQQDLDAEIKALEEEKQTALKTSIDKVQTEKEFNKKIADIKTDAAEKDKKASIIQSIINTALAVTKTLATVPPPVSFVLAGITAALGAAQTALIAAKPIPKFAQGTAFSPGSMALVGEQGPELVRLPQGSQVTPNQDIRNITNADNRNVNISVQTNDPIEFVNTLRREHGIDVFGEA